MAASVNGTSVTTICLTPSGFFTTPGTDSVSIVPMRGGRGLDAEIVLLGYLLSVRGNIDEMCTDNSCVGMRDISAVLTCTRLRVLLLGLQIIQ